MRSRAGTFTRRSTILCGFARTSDLRPILEALACLEAGDWERAHKIAQDDPSPEAAWVHAHLHRMEGDLWNARYWYRRAARPEPAGSLEEERRTIIEALRA